MVILQDSRDKTPLEFYHPYIAEIKVKKLIVGDYMVEFSDGYIPPISIERKSLTDLIGTLSKGYPRFKKEIIRAKENNIQLIILIESSMSKVLKGIEESYRSGDEILQQLFTITVRHKVPFACCNNREESQRWIIEYFLAHGREYIIRKKSNV